jgi:hypothetical protein
MLNYQRVTTKLPLHVDTLRDQPQGPGSILVFVPERVKLDSMVMLLQMLGLIWFTLRKNKHGP